MFNLYRVIHLECNFHRLDHYNLSNNHKLLLNICKFLAFAVKWWGHLLPRCWLWFHRPRRPHLGKLTRTRSTCLLICVPRKPEPFAGVWPSIRYCSVVYFSLNYLCYKKCLLNSEFIWLTGCLKLLSFTLVTWNATCLLLIFISFKFFAVSAKIMSWMSYLVLILCVLTCSKEINLDQWTFIVIMIVFSFFVIFHFIFYL